MEKAHPEVFNALLQILEDGRLTDGQGRVVDFRNTVIIMTSNVGTSGLTLRAGPVGFFGGDGAADEAERQLRDRIMDSLRRTFRPEFLNRIDETIVFHRLTRPQLRTVVDKLLSDLRERLTERDIELTLTAAARDWLLGPRLRRGLRCPAVAPAHSAGDREHDGPRRARQRLHRR